MRITTPLRTLVLCALVASTAATGCSDKGSDAEASASWSALRETHAIEQEAEAIRDAEQAVRDYYQVRDRQCLSDPPNTDPSCYDEVSVDNQLSNDRDTLEWVQDTGRRHVGEIEVLSTERVVDVQLPVGTKEVTLSMCINASDLDILGPDDTSLKPPSSTQRVLHLYVVRKHTDRWQVADILDDPEGETC